MMYVLNLIFSLCLLSSAPAGLIKKGDTVPNGKKQQSGWEILFDGSGTEKWKSKSDEGFPEKGWKVENGLLFLAGKGGGDIITREKYSEFELVFEFMLTKGANSGIKYFVDTIVNQETGNKSINGPEYQIIDDYNNVHVKDDPNGLSSAGSAYLLYAPENKKLNPAGQWNTGRIVAKNNIVEHWLNGVRVVKYKRGSNDFLEKKAETKFKNDVNYGEPESGYIMLTDHNDTVYFREIKIRKLK